MKRRAQPKESNSEPNVNGRIARKVFLGLAGIVLLGLAVSAALAIIDGARKSVADETSVAYDTQQALSATEASEAESIRLTDAQHGLETATFLPPAEQTAALDAQATENQRVTDEVATRQTQDAQTQIAMTQTASARSSMGAPGPIKPTWTPPLRHSPTPTHSPTAVPGQQPSGNGTGGSDGGIATPLTLVQGGTTPMPVVFTPTPTIVPPSLTPVSPSPTPLPPSATPIPPSNTPIPPTFTLVPPTPTWTESPTEPAYAFNTTDHVNGCTIQNRIQNVSGVDVLIEGDLNAYPDGGGESIFVGYQNRVPVGHEGWAGPIGNVPAGFSGIVKGTTTAYDLAGNSKGTWPWEGHVICP